MSIAHRPAPMDLDPMTVARAFKESGMFPDLQSEAQAVVKIVAGQEVGFGPMAAMQAVQMIQGRPTFSANALAALVKRHPAYNYRTREHTAEVCSIEFFEDGEPCGISTFSMADAQAAGLNRNQTWEKYPKAMLFARALSQGVRWYAPDVTAGAAAYVPEELGGEAEIDETHAAPAGADPLLASVGGDASVTAAENGRDAAGGPDTAATIDAERAEQIVAALHGLKFKEINLLLGAAGADAVRAFSAKALGERIESLSDEQADALLAELKGDGDGDA